jgi:hypothetical protein
MLTNDPKRLRLLGIDLHARTRRRAAVVITYLGYFIGIAALGTFFQDKQTPWSEYLSMFAWTLAVMHFGLFRTKGPVKRMDERPNVYRDMVLLRGLDDWSRYRHGSNFEALSAEQQHEVLMKYKVGNYLFPEKNKHAGFDPDAPDERELAERNRAYNRALQLMTTFLFSLTGVMIERAAHHRSPGDMPSLFMALGLAAVTLPKAVILWNEADPRELLEVREES